MILGNLSSNCGASDNMSSPLIRPSLGTSENPDREYTKSQNPLVDAHDPCDTRTTALKLTFR